MPMPMTLMMALGKAGLNVAGVGFVGDITEIARAVWKLWNKGRLERLAEVAGVICADDVEVGRVVDQIVSAVASGKPEPVRQSLANALRRVPAQIRQSQRRPNDPTGRTIRPGMVLERPEDLIPFLQERQSRYRPGQQPPGVGDWVLDEWLGSGGFGEVWKARHAHFDSFKPVALKFCTDPLARERLLKHEAKVCARVMKQGHHLGIVALQATYLSADPPCLQYEYIQGGDLGGLIKDWHRQDKKPTPETVAKVMLRIAWPVAFMHEAKPLPIVHRDLKPANILVHRSGAKTVFMVTDFGIGGIATAQAIQASCQPTTPSEFMTEAVRGSCTLLYSSPEQLRGDDPDPRDDVHSLGIIWFQMMTGDLTKGRPSGRGWRRRFLDLGMSPAMLDLLDSCFEDQEDRPANAGVLVSQLAGLLEKNPSCPTEVVGKLETAGAATKKRTKDSIWLELACLGLLSLVLLIIYIFYIVSIGAQRNGEVSDTPIANTPKLNSIREPSKFGPTLGKKVETYLSSIREPSKSDPTLEKKIKATPETTAKQAPKDVPSAVASSREWTNSIGMTLISIKAGTFTMGSTDAQLDLLRADLRSGFANEQPPHTVRITKPFLLATYEVTNKQYQTVTGSPPPDFFNTEDNHPVTFVSWHDAVIFCNKLSELECRKPYYVVQDKAVKVVGGNGYRLPTEAEWEYACRAGSTTLFPFGDDKVDLAKYAWTSATLTAPGNGERSVGEMKPNKWGLYDMLGNVEEWCQDRYEAYHDPTSPVTDPPDANPATSVIHRGGDYHSDWSSARPASRTCDNVDSREHQVGFRVARDQYR